MASSAPHRLHLQPEGRVRGDAVGGRRIGNRPRARGQRVEDQVAIPLAPGMYRQHWYPHRL